MSSRQTTQTGKIAVVGEKELVLGYRLLGVEDATTTTKEDAQKTVLDYFNSGKYGLIIVGSEARKGLSAATKEKLESSIVPLVVFMPSTTSTVQEESLSRLAKRVLGVDLKVGA
ncbi:MAG TPA: V-type ATP synthase subunit F [Nitrososphaerales archaeon]|nr:V-type ATP synthase subunit F [Nitrososphaerales archaeon]HUK75126.1 V-type ATP synthase subunit F [Nitrososphaerales archaeon]